MFQIVVTYWDGTEIPMSAFTEEGFLSLATSCLKDPKIRMVHCTKPVNEESILANESRV